ncbi:MULTISPECIES: hypothetical protein [Paenibacillus]|uniref:hypothetical protein n=1 Tax=Paenibacillus TaxID=44249 RepID=UPI00041F2ABC|nr:MULTISPECIES: hypothetical protein [Paenibacillus]KKC47412.1 hypothetical protein VE23_10035 [Paenibacillus sp. D9]
MSMPNVPNIRPDIQLKRHDVLNLLLSSIALEEMGLSNIINAEGEKLQKVIHAEESSSKDLMEVNESVERMMRIIIKNQMLLQFKLEDVIKLEKSSFQDEYQDEYHDEIHEE